ncbi:coiled-coil domain-containing protein 178 [Genypterus blacodes]|uniref:coiled-coil domain-containing protein 178 n=1 Tax=Genypterus blacodes TaxID=154954 RepID=UPI003F757952
MPDIEPLRFPSREGKASEQDQRDLPSVCSGRRRCCISLSSPSPCVNKAVFHIQELKLKAESWCQQCGKFPPQIERDKHQYSQTLRFQHIDSDTDTVLCTDLYIEGIGIGERGEYTVFSIHLLESSPVSPVWKKISDVLGEVVSLIERLEADRQDAEEAFQKETRRKRILESKVASISQWKKQEHSVVVQKEHEACVRDITELKWHLNLEQEKLDQAQEKLCHIEVLNRRLHEDISFVNKQAPLVKENLEFQTGIINEINSAQAEADKTYAKTLDNLKLAERELETMALDANNEKASMEQELQNVKNQLADRLEEFNQLKTQEEGLCAEKQQAEQSVALGENESAALAQSIPERMELEKAINKQIFQLRGKIRGEMQKTKKLKEEIAELQEDIQKTKLNGEEEVSQLEELLHSKRDSLAALRKENMEYEVKVEDYKMRISESEKTVTQMQEYRKEMLQRIRENEEQREGVKEEVTQAVAQHSVVKASLEKQEQLTFMEEQRTRNVMENLGRELANETAAVGRLKTRCANVTEELHQHGRSSEIVNERLRREFDQASSTTKALEVQMEKIKALTEKLEGIQRQHRNTMVNLEREKKLRLEHLNAAKDVHADTVKRYDYAVDRISDLGKKRAEYRDASDKMEVTAASMSDVIAELRGAFDVAEFRNKSAALIMSTLQSDINNCLHRAQRSMQTHTAHVTARRRKMEDIKEALEVALRENAVLATEYEGLQLTSMNAKQEATSALSKKNTAHRSFHYYTQLSLLQKRMHKALVKYFKQRSLYSQAELDRCQALSRETDQKIKTAQGELSSEIQHISAFLQSLTDDSTTSDDVGVNKQASPHATGSND